MITLAFLISKSTFSPRLSGYGEFAPSLGTNGHELANNCNPNILYYQDF